MVGLHCLMAGQTQVKEKRIRKTKQSMQAEINGLKQKVGLMERETMAHAQKLKSQILSLQEQLKRSNETLQSVLYEKELLERSIKRTDKILSFMPTQPSSVDRHHAV